MKLVFPYKKCYNCITVDEHKGDIKKSLLRLNEQTKYDEIECNLRNVKLDESSIVNELKGFFPYEVYIIKGLRLLKDFGVLTAFIPKFEFSDEFIKEMQKYGEVIEFDKYSIKIKKRYFVKNKSFYDKIDEIRQKSQKVEKIDKNEQIDQNSKNLSKNEKIVKNDKNDINSQKDENLSKNEEITQNEQKVEKCEKVTENDKNEEIEQNNEKAQENKKTRKKSSNSQKTTRRRGRPKKSKKGE